MADEVYGDGSDGNVTITEDYVVTSNKQYNNLTINAGVLFDTRGYVIRVKTTFTNNGTVTDTQNGGSGGNGGAAIVSGYGVGTNGNPGTSGSTGAIEGAGSGGDGGGSGGRGGGWYNYDGADTHLVKGGAAGAGAKGGKGGGAVKIYAKTLTNNSVIHANGLAADDDATAGGQGTYYIRYNCGAIGGSGGGGGGGNGGNGGLVKLIYETRTEGTVTANGGNKSSGKSGGAQLDPGQVVYMVTNYSDYPSIYYSGGNGGTERGGAGGAAFYGRYGIAGSDGTDGNDGSAGTIQWELYSAPKKNRGNFAIFLR